MIVIIFSTLVLICKNAADVEVFNFVCKYVVLSVGRLCMNVMNDFRIP